MWIFCDSGFYSVVKKTGDDKLTVRTRVRSDLERFVKESGTCNPIKENTGTDYWYRVQVYPEEFALWLSRKGAEINYSNFKDMVSKCFGLMRSCTYHRIWVEALSLNSIDRSERGKRG